jgi:hypothetical protein
MSHGSDDPGNDHAGKLAELVARSERTISAVESERKRWQSWGEAFTAGLRRGAGANAGDSGISAPIRIELAQVPERPLWKGLARFGQILSLVTVLLSVGGLFFTIVQYQQRIAEINATTIYDVAREGRSLARDLRAGTATTGQGINYHFSVYYLQEKGVVDEPLRPLLLLDLCSFIKAQPDFKDIWQSVSIYYPVSFRTAVVALQGLRECTLPALEGLATRISVLEGK